MNGFAYWLLTMTGASPVFAAAAVKEGVANPAGWVWGLWGAVSLLLLVLCAALLHYARVNVQIQPVKVAEWEPHTPRHPWVFLVLFISLVVLYDPVTATDGLHPALFAFVVLSLSPISCMIGEFIPSLWLLGFRHYIGSDTNGRTIVLAARKQPGGDELKAVHFFSVLHLHINAPVKSH